MNNILQTSGARSNIRWLMLCGLAALPGCGSGVEAPPTVPVTGTVTMNGQPLDGAQVAFIHKDADGGKPANGVTDSAGNFQLQTYLGGTSQAKGAMPGDYTVTIQKTEAPASPTKDASQGAMPGAGTPLGPDPQSLAPQPKLLTPEKYADPAQGEKVTVKAEGENVFKFDLVE